VLFTGWRGNLVGMAKQASLSTRVLDTAIGRPAGGIFIVLERYDDTERDWQVIAETKTDASGRVEELLPGGELEEGLYRITFDTDAYFGEQGVETFYPSVSVNFQISEPARKYHVPLLLSPHGYSTFGIT
jgi:5-hydroxyisourate hydrolase